VQAHGGTSGPDAKTTDTAESWHNQNSAGTGPFMMTRYTPDTEIDIATDISPDAVADLQAIRRSR
jgi:peptide/nickel transport system substrate-binding protein